MSHIYTKQIAIGFNFPNVTVYKVFKDGVFDRYDAETGAGYVMYDETQKSTVIDPMTMQEVTYVYYCSAVSFPKTYDMTKFPYKAVLKALVNP